MEEREQSHSFIVFPYLKTTGPVNLGGLTFRSTEDASDLSSKQADQLAEIAEMLFLQDDSRIKSASYAIVRFIDLTYLPQDVDDLVNIQAAVAYFYASPRHEFGDLFLSSEHASMIIFTPRPISIYSLQATPINRPEKSSELQPDDRDEVEGYEALYNFRHHFWVAKGSRVYGPKPCITLNDSQDLKHDLNWKAGARADYGLLYELLETPDTEPTSRVFTSVRWFNLANNEANDDATAIVNLAIAFESLLNLPRGAKTDRLVDAVSLLLGRTPRLDSWVEQFYDARSRIVHEGTTTQFRFLAPESQAYQSLLSYGRQVFQLCVGTILVGAALAREAGLAEKLVTNEERLSEVCKISNDDASSIASRLERIGPIVSAAQRYRYIPESGLRLKTMIGATQRVAAMLAQDEDMNSESLKEHLEELLTAERGHDHFDELEALMKLHLYLKENPRSNDLSGSDVLANISDLIVHYTFRHYYWLKERRDAEASTDES